MEIPNFGRRKIQPQSNSILSRLTLDETVEVIGLPPNARAIAETDLDGTYVLTAEELEESDKVKLFEHFIEDLKQVIEESQ